MEIQIKKAVKAGNSSAVILPRAWLNQEVRIELVKKDEETILFETLEIAKKYINIDKIIGIYLVGSYARGEETSDSDIDILIISDNIDKEMIKEGIYNILIVSRELLVQKIERDLLPVGQMIKEARALINSSYLESIEVRVSRKNVSWYLKTSEQKLKTIKDHLKLGSIDNRAIYTLILRIRTLNIIENLIKNKEYSKKEFLKIIKNISGSLNAYNSYLAVKDDLDRENKTTKEEVEKLVLYLEKQLENVKNKLDR